jgi:hypothetical protein
MNTSKTCPIVEALRDQNILPSNIITENFLHQSSIINHQRLPWGSRKQTPSQISNSLYAWWEKHLVHHGLYMIQMTETREGLLQVAR